MPQLNRFDTRIIKTDSSGVADNGLCLVIRFSGEGCSNSFIGSDNETTSSSSRGSMIPATHRAASGKTETNSAIFRKPMC